MIQPYSDAISYLAENKVNKFFRNTGEVNKNLTLLNLIKNSKKEIKIFETELNTSEYNRKTIEELFSFIWNRNGNLSILIDNLSKHSVFYEFIRGNYCSTNIKVNITDKKFLNKSLHKEGYFVLGDNSGFALFFDHGGDKKTIGNFNDKEHCKNFEEFFENTFNHEEYSTPLNVLEKCF